MGFKKRWTTELSTLTKWAFGPILPLLACAQTLKPKVQIVKTHDDKQNEHCTSTENPWKKEISGRDREPTVRVARFMNFKFFLGFLVIECG